MKPRNKYQARIVGLQEKLPKLSDAEIQWAYDNSFKKYYIYSRNRFYCTECNHKWKPDPSPLWHATVTGCTCPNCGERLISHKYNHTTNFSLYGYVGYLTVVDEFQVERIVYVAKHVHAKKLPRYCCWEVSQKFMDETGETTTFAKMTNGSIYGDRYQLHSDLELRDAYDVDNRYRVTPSAVHPKRKILPIFKRNGFKGRFYGIPPHLFLYKLLHAPRFETLLKMKQPALLMEYVGFGSSKVEKYWSSIRICFRNNYIVKDSTIWFDYLDLLVHFNKDLTSPKYVCPADLNKAHDRLVAKKREIERRRKAEKLRKSFGKINALLKEQKGHFFGMTFTDGDITIKVLQTAQEYYDEANTHKHCVFENEYYKKSGTLCLSARKGEELLETIEVSLQDYTIRQSRGLFNKNTKHHSRIVDLVNSNMNEIRRRHELKKKRKSKKNERQHAA